MARSRKRKKQGGNAEALILKALATLIVLLVMIGSFLLLAAWLFFERKNSRLAKPTSLSFFNNTSDEVALSKNQTRALDRIYSRLDAIEIEGQRIPKRQDGLYNERSQKGKQFNIEVAELNNNANSLESSLSVLDSLPQKRLNEWAFYVSMNLALRISVVSYLLSFASFAWFQPKWVTQLSTTLQNYSLLDFYSSYPIAYGASVGALVISLLFLVISYFYFREQKIDELSENKQNNIRNNTQIIEENISTDEIIDYLSQISHATLKSIVDNFGIEANKRSKASIIDALKMQSEDKILEIYNSIQPE